MSKCALVAHNMTHTGEKKFQCYICGKRTGRAADLTIHMRSHTGKLQDIYNQFRPISYFVSLFLFSCSFFAILLINFIFDGSLFLFLQLQVKDRTDAINVLRRITLPATSQPTKRLIWVSEITFARFAVKRSGIPGLLSVTRELIPVKNPTFVTCVVAGIPNRDNWLRIGKLTSWESKVLRMLHELR